MTLPSHTSRRAALAVRPGLRARPDRGTGGGAAVDKDEQLKQAHRCEAADEDDCPGKCWRRSPRFSASFNSTFLNRAVEFALATRNMVTTCGATPPGLVRLVGVAFGDAWARSAAVVPLGFVLFFAGFFARGDEDRDARGCHSGGDCENGQERGWSHDRLLLGVVMSVAVPAAPDINER